MEGSWRTIYRCHQTLVALLACASGACVVWFVLTGSGTGLAMAAAMAAPAALLGFSLRDRPYDPFHPLTIVGAVLIHGAALQGTYLVFTDSPQAHALLLLDLPPATLLGGATAILIGAVAAAIGYSLPKGRMELARFHIFSDPPLNRRRLIFVSLALSAFAGVALMLYLQRLGLGWAALLEAPSQKRLLEIDSLASYRFASLGYYRWAAEIPIYAFLFAWAIAVDRRWTAPPSVIASVVMLAVASCVAPVINSARGPIIAVLIGLVLVAGMMRRHVPLIHVVVASIVVVFIYVGLGSVRSAGLEQALPHMRDRISSAVVETRNGVSIGKTSVIVHLAPGDSGFVFGRSLISWIYAPIPRTVWPDKPMVRIGREVGPQMFGNPETSGVPPGLVGELYLNGGWAAIVLGMVAYGMLLRFVVNSFRPLVGQSRNATVAYVFALIVLCFMLPGSDVTGGVENLAQAAVGLAVVFLVSTQSRFAPVFLGRRRRGTSAIP